MILLTNIVLLSFIQALQDLDILVLKAIYENRYPALDTVFRFITDTAAALAFGIPGTLLIISLYRTKGTLKKNALLILVSVALSAIISNILKYAIDLPRPYEIYPFIEKLSRGGSPSFPSGHTADAFAFAVASVIVYRKWFILIPCIVWAALVGYSRMSLGVHFPSDVIAGAIIGTGCALGCSWIIKRDRAKTN